MRLSCSCRVLHPPTTPCSAPRPPPPPLPRVHQVEGREDQGDERGLGGVGPFGYPTLLRTMYIINCRLALATFCTTTTTTMYVCVYYQLNVTEHKKIEKFYLFYFYLDRVFICHTNLPTQKMSFFCPFIGKKRTIVYLTFDQKRPKPKSTSTSRTTFGFGLSSSGKYLFALRLKKLLFRIVVSLIYINIKYKHIYKYIYQPLLVLSL